MSPRRWLLVLFFLLLPALAHATPQNVIIVIGDGMGPEHEAAARLYAGGPLAWDAAPNQATMTTDSLSGLTDSAASASAMATGQKYFNFAISQALDGTQPLTVLEFYAALGKSTGLVTTSYIEDASTAAFGAHAANRFLYGDITDDYLNGSRPNVLLGSTNPGDAILGTGMDPVKAAAAGYAVATDRAELNAIDITLATHVSGQFGVLDRPSEYEYAIGGNTFYDSQPFLNEMAGFAIDLLSQDPDGFFLLIEQEGMDIAGHDAHTGPSRIGADVFAALELSTTVQNILDWIAGRADPTDTLLIVTADHETGGLAITADNGPGNLPTVTWAHPNHTNVPVNVYAWGRNGELVTGALDNTDIFSIATAVPEPGIIPLLGAGFLLVASRRRQR